MVGAIVLNGEKYLGRIEGDFVVCCDGGYNKSDRCDYFVGDRDSVVGEVICSKIELMADKNMTDGEVGIDLLIEKGVDEIIVYGLDGGRLDHILMNITLMARAVKGGVACRAEANTFKAYMTTRELKIDVELNSVISLVPFSDELHITYTKGLQYPLKNYIASKFNTRTISNVAVSSSIEIGIEGYALVIVNTNI